MIRLALIAVLLAFGASRAWAIDSPSEMLPNHAQELRAEQIGEQLRCLVCQNESIEDSSADLAKDLRHIVRERVAAGQSNQQIIRWMVARYGQFVRLRPAFEPLTWVLWFSPFLALAVGGVSVFLVRRRHASPPAPLDAAERERLARLLRS